MKKQLHSSSITDSLSLLSVSRGMCRASARARTVRCGSSLITVAVILMLVAITTVHSAPSRSLNSADSRPSTKALCHCRIIESPNISFPNDSFNHVVVSNSIFSLSTYKIWWRSVVPQTHLFFQNIQWHTAWCYTSVLHHTLTFFSFFTSTAVHICSNILACFISQEKHFFSLPARTIIRCRDTSTCF